MKPRTKKTLQLYGYSIALFGFSMLIAAASGNSSSAGDDGRTLVLFFMLLSASLVAMLIAVARTIVPTLRLTALFAFIRLRQRLKQTHESMQITVADYDRAKSDK